MMSEVGLHAQVTFEEVAKSGTPTRPLEFPPPKVARGVRVQALVIDLERGVRDVWPNVIHREDLLSGDREVQAFFPIKRLQDAIYGSVWAAIVLRRHHGPAADDAARAAGLEPGSPQAPIVWETSKMRVAIKMVDWSRVHRMRGRLLEDPVKEVAALQLIGADHPHVLGSIDVMQDENYLYSVMPYCRGGDLFGIVVRYAEEAGGERGMPEPVARYWFRQILWVSGPLEILIVTLFVAPFLTFTRSDMMPGITPTARAGNLPQGSFPREYSSGCRKLPGDRYGHVFACPLQ